MKKILPLVLLVSSLFGGELNWIHNYDFGLQLAKKEHKDIYLFIGADNCRFCKKFKAKTLSQKRVMDALHKDFILIYLSRDQHYIPDKFERFGAPRHYFLDANGKILDEDAGYRNPDMFLELIQEVRFYR